MIYSEIREGYAWPTYTPAKPPKRIIPKPSRHTAKANYHEIPNTSHRDIDPPPTRKHSGRPRGGNRDLVLQHLDQPRTRRELLKLTQLSDNQVAFALRVLLDTGAISRQLQTKPSVVFAVYTRTQ